MSLLRKRKIIYERRGGVDYVAGRIVKDSPKKDHIKGMVQPERNLTLIRETFGSHVEAAIKVYSEEKLKTQEKDCDADIILWDNRRWEVSQVRKYEDVRPHYKMIAILVKGEK